MPNPEPDSVGTERLQALSYQATTAVELIRRTIAPALLDSTSLRIERQSSVDQCLLDTFPDYSPNGACRSALLALSLACCRAGSARVRCALYEHISHQCGYVVMGAWKLPNMAFPSYSMPVPTVRLFSGGHLYASRMGVRSLSLLPLGFSRFADAMRAASEAFALMKRSARDRWGSSVVDSAEDGSIVPSAGASGRVEDLLRFVSAAMEGWQERGKCRWALHCDASRYWSAGSGGGRYDVDYKRAHGDRRGELRAEALAEWYRDVVNWSALSSGSGVVQLVDAFAEEDVEAWRRLTFETSVSMPEGTQIVG